MKRLSMYRNILLSLTILFGMVSLQAQEFTVKSFKAVANDVSALMNEKTDINGEKCAIIKVLTNVEGAFYNAAFDIEDQELKKPGEIWLWVRAGEKRLNVSKSGYVPLNYNIPLKIESSKVYQIEIRGDLVKDALLVTFMIEPNDATIIIDGDTAQHLIPFPLGKGEHNLDITKSSFYQISKTIQVDETNVFFRETMEKIPDVVTQFKSSVEGAKVYLNETLIGETPLTYATQPGTYQIKITSPGFIDIIEELKLEGTTASKTYELSENAGFIVVNVLDADVYINNEKVGVSPIRYKVMPGEYVVKCVKDKHYDDEQSVAIALGEEKEVPLNPKARMGSLQVTTTPNDARGATVLIDGMEKTGTTPTTFPLLMGEYQVVVKKQGFLEEKQSVVIKEGKEEKIDLFLQTYSGSLNQKKNRANRNRFIWLGATLASAGYGAYAMNKANKDYEAYGDATSSADELRKSVEQNDKIFPIAFGVSAGCFVGFLISNKRYGKFKKQLKITTSGTDVGFIYSF